MYTLLFKEDKEIFKMFQGYKEATARPINNNNKNIKIGDKVKLLIGFKEIGIIEITNIKYVEDITKEPLTTFKKLGYKTKKEYINKYKEKQGKKQVIFYFKIISYDLNKYIEETKKQ